MRTPDFSINGILLRDVYLVYVVNGKRGEVLYVGFSSVGISRLSKRHHALRGKRRNEIGSIDSYLCGCETDARKLEARLISEHSPAWNNIIPRTHIYKYQKPVIMNGRRKRKSKTVLLPILSPESKHFNAWIQSEKDGYWN